MTIAFESFVEPRGQIHDQMIRNRKKQKMIAMIRARKFQRKLDSPIWSEGINSSLYENISFSIEYIWIPPFLNRILFKFYCI